MKRTIRLTESDLREVIKESVTRILKEDFNSSTLYNAMNSAWDKMEHANGTPEFGKRERQFRTFQRGYGKAFKKEYNQDRDIINSDVTSLTWNDTMADGTPLRLHFCAGIFVGEESNGYTTKTDWEQLEWNENMQRFFCRMKPKTAEMVARWWKENHIYPNNKEYGKAGFDPSFWTKFSNQ
jgi:hypothetical protein